MKRPHEILASEKGNEQTVCLNLSIERRENIGFLNKEHSAARVLTVCVWLAIAYLLGIARSVYQSGEQPGGCDLWFVMEWWRIPQNDCSSEILLKGL